MFRANAGAIPDGPDPIAPLANRIPVVRTEIVSNPGNVTAYLDGAENSATYRETNPSQYRHLLD